MPVSVCTNMNVAEVSNLATSFRAIRASRLIALLTNSNEFVRSKAELERAERSSTAPSVESVNRARRQR